MKFGPLVCVLLLTPVVSADVMDFDDLVIWAGSGSNEAGMVVDWQDGKAPLAWGFRWDGMATGEDMFRAIAAVDDNFYALINDTFSFGNFVAGIGYDRDEDGFDITSPVTFDADGLYVGPTPSEGVSLDADDSYGESSDIRFEYWQYFIGVGNPLNGGTWESPASFGFSGRTLSDGDWDGWLYPGFAPGAEPSSAPLAAGATPVPEPSTWAVFALLSTGFAVRRVRQRRKSADTAA